MSSAILNQTLLTGWPCALKQVQTWDLSQWVLCHHTGGACPALFKTWQQQVLGTSETKDNCELVKLWGNFRLDNRGLPWPVI